MSDKNSTSQRDRFIEAARELGADDDEATFKAKLAVIARQKPRNRPPEITDATLIHEMTTKRLEKIGADESGWTVAYRDPKTGDLWELTYPSSERLGGGSPLLRRI